jgi:ketopantoate reductase
VVQAMRECATVARAEGVSLEAFDFLDPNALLGARPEDQARVEQDLKTIRAHFGEIKSGTWRDIAVRHIPTEVPYALGEVVRRGQQAGVPIPILTALFDMLTAIEAGEKPMSRGNLNELAAAGQAEAQR